MVQSVVQVPNGFNAQSVAPITEMLNGLGNMRDAYMAANIQHVRQQMALAQAQVDARSALATNIMDPAFLSDPRRVAGGLIGAAGATGSLADLGPAGLALSATRPGITPADQGLQNAQVGAGHPYTATYQGTQEEMANRLAQSNIAAGPAYAGVNERAREFNVDPQAVIVGTDANGALAPITGHMTRAQMLAPGSTAKPILSQTQAEGTATEQRRAAINADPTLSPAQKSLALAQLNPSTYNETTKPTGIIRPGTGPGVPATPMTLPAAQIMPSDILMSPSETGPTAASRAALTNPIPPEQAQAAADPLLAAKPLTEKRERIVGEKESTALLLNVAKAISPAKLFDPEHYAQGIDPDTLNFLHNKAAQILNDEGGTASEAATKAVEWAKANGLQIGNERGDYSFLPGFISPSVPAKNTVMSPQDRSLAAAQTNKQGTAKAPNVQASPPPPPAPAPATTSPINPQTGKPIPYIVQYGTTKNGQRVAKMSDGSIVPALTPVPPGTR